MSYRPRSVVPAGRSPSGRKLVESSPSSLSESATLPCVASFQVSCVSLALHVCPASASMMRSAPLWLLRHPVMVPSELGIIGPLTTPHIRAGLISAVLTNAYTLITGDEFPMNRGGPDERGKPHGAGCGGHKDREDRGPHGWAGGCSRGRLRRRALLPRGSQGAASVGRGAP